MLKLEEMLDPESPHKRYQNICAEKPIGEKQSVNLPEKLVQ